MLLKTTMSYQFQNEHYIRALFIFLAGHFQQLPILLFFAQDIVSLKVYDKIVKKQLTFDLYIRMLRNCLAYFSQNPQIRNWCKNWEFCSLAAHYFPRVVLSVYFCFSCQICAHAQFFVKIKTSASRPYDGNLGV